jgi:hypothetical protein
VFPEGFLLVWFWLIAAGTTAAYVFLFLCSRRQVSLRLRRMGCWLLVLLGSRLGIVLLGYPLTTQLDIGLTACAFVGAWGFLMPRIWLIRAETQTLRQEIQTACAGLFLEFTEPLPGHWLLISKARSWPLRLINLGRNLQLIVLPRASGPGKVTLLVQWLSKQYPGPVPRLHIVLKKE